MTKFRVALEVLKVFSQGDGVIRVYNQYKSILSSQAQKDASETGGGRGWRKLKVNKPGAGCNE